MTKREQRKYLGRRRFLQGAGGVAALALGSGLVPGFLRKVLPGGVAEAQSVGPPDLFFGGTDGWMHLPDYPPISYFHPDNLAPSPLLNTYIFGFRNLTGLNLADDATTISSQKNKAQHSAPLFWVNQFDPANPRDFKLDLTNLGLAIRPDLTDAHTVHWHGFRNVIPFFDGEPTSSVAVPVGRVFRYIYRPRDPGTYMFHCHVEDTEHVHMGMTGIVFVRPLQDGNTLLYPSGKYAYNDGDGSTGFDREFVMFLSEVWAEAHWADSHIQLPDWTDYRADFALLNGRVFPDTLAPNGSIDPFNPARDPNGDLIAPDGYPELQYQPLSALVRCNAGERVLLRFANLGFRESTMTLAGIRLRVVGKDATPMRGRGSPNFHFRTGVSTSYDTDTVSFGAGESIDAIFTAPSFQPAPAPIFTDDQGRSYNRYLLYNRRYALSNNLGGGFGGQRTEIRVYAPGTLVSQSIPNT